MNINGKKKGWIIAGLSTVMVLACGGTAFAARKLPGSETAVWNQVNRGSGLNQIKSYGWESDAQGNWYYRDTWNNGIKTGWLYDQAGGYWYYLSPTDGKMVTGWQTIGGKQYFFQPVQAGANYPFASEKEKNRYMMNSRFPYGAMYANTMTIDGVIVDESGARADGAVIASEAAPAVFSDESFVGFYCEYYSWEYNARTHESKQVKTTLNQYRQARSKYPLEQGYGIDPYFLIDRISGGYIDGYYNDGSTGASLDLRGKIHAAIDENGVARYYDECEGYTMETVIELQREGSEWVIHLQAIVHKHDNFNAVASDWLKMELGGINGTSVYRDDRLIKYD